VRRLPTPGAVTGEAGQRSLGPRLIVLSNVGTDTLTMRREARHAASSDDVTRSAAHGTATFAADSPGRAAVALRTDGQKLDYAEDGVLELSGIRVGSGLYWYLPGAREASVARPTALAAKQP
jgi:hypothetical protein